MFRRTLALSAAAVLLAAGLSACTNPIDQLVQGGVEQGVEEAIEQATGGKVDIDTGGGASLPSDFPADVPVPPGTITSSLTTDGIFQIMTTLDDVAQGADFAEEIEAAGYTLTTSQDLGEMKVWILENGTWTLSVTTIDGESPYLSYTVGPVG